MPNLSLCTHFDHVGQTAREESAKLLVKIADERGRGENMKGRPVFLGGFNVTPENKAYTTLASKMSNVNDVVPNYLHFDHKNTHTGFSMSTSDKEVDYIFVNDIVGLE